MKLVHPNSLAQTLDAINEAHFYGVKISTDQREAAAHFIAARQGQGGSYAGMFAPMKQDWGASRLFCGEAIKSGAATSHILSEEACRALIILHSRSKDAQRALAVATDRLWEYLEKSGSVFTAGTHCCGSCSVSWWRHMTAANPVRYRSLLERGLATLKTRRLGNGRWRAFPFYYTLVGLLEIDLPAAREELAYAADACHRGLRQKGAGKFAQRRRDILNRVLAI